MQIILPPFLPMVQVRLPYSFCNTVTSVKKDPFLKTLHFHLRIKSDSGRHWRRYYDAGSKVSDRGQVWRHWSYSQRPKTIFWRRPRIVMQCVHFLICRILFRWTSCFRGWTDYSKITIIWCFVRLFLFWSWWTVQAVWVRPRTGAFIIIVETHKLSPWFVLFRYQISRKAGWMEHIACMRTWW
jgi:hypothetical protein